MPGRLLGALGTQGPGCADTDQVPGRQQAKNDGSNDWIVLEEGLGRKDPLGSEGRCGAGLEGMSDLV